MRRSGVPVVDCVIGGLAPGLPLVLAGPPGSGRTVLAIQIADAALRESDIVAFLSAEPAPLLLRQAATLGIDLESAVESGQLILLELDPRAPASLQAAGGRALMAAILAEHPSTSLIVIDPCTALTKEMIDEAPLRAVARDWVAATPRATLVLTVETDLPGSDAAMERVLSEVCGSYLSLSRESDGRRTLGVEKTRAGAGRAEAVEFRIGPHGAEPVREIRLEPMRAGPASPPPAPEAKPAPAPQPEPAAQPSAREPQPAAPRPQREGPPKILLVDADDASQARLRDSLAERYAVVTASDGFEAMARLLSERPDLIVLDLVLPRISGAEVLAALHGAAESIPILAISNRMESGRPRLGPIVLGAADVLVRPVECFELLHKVEMLLRLEAPPTPLLDPDDARALFGSTAPTRVLPPAEFRDRLRRARDFGARFRVGSTLVAIAASSGEELDALTASCDATLRFEDAVLLTSKRRALVLLVAAETGDAPLAVGRIAGHLSEKAKAPVKLRWRAYDATMGDAAGDWRELFRDLEEWPEESGA